MYPEIITEIESLYKIMVVCHKEYIVTQYGTLTMERLSTETTTENV